MCYFRSVPKSPVASCGCTGMWTHHPQRKQSSHSVDSARVRLPRSLLLTQLVFVHMTDDCRRAPRVPRGGALTRIHQYRSHPSLESADGWDGWGSHRHLTHNQQRARGTLPSVSTS